MIGRCDIARAGKGERGDWKIRVSGEYRWRRLGLHSWRILALCQGSRSMASELRLGLLVLGIPPLLDQEKALIDLSISFSSMIAAPVRRLIF